MQGGVYIDLPGVPISANGFLSDGASVRNIILLNRLAAKGC
jgi:hypothetical protein